MSDGLMFVADYLTVEAPESADVGMVGTVEVFGAGELVLRMTPKQAREFAGNLQSMAADAVSARIERIAELKTNWSESTQADPGDYDRMTGDDWKAGLSDDDAAELVALLEQTER